jgi:hypothetical protein
MLNNAAQPNPGAEEDKLVWGAKAIGAALNLDPRQAFYQLEAGRIPGATKWGRKWAAPGRILRQLATGEVPPQ